MTRFSIIALLILMNVLGVVSCGDDDNPVTPGRRVTDLWIDSHYVLYPASDHYHLPSDGLVLIREGSGTGPVVDNVTVVMNLDSLAFDDTQKDYRGTVQGLVEGDNLTLTVADGSSSMHKTLNLPHAPMNLALSGGFWDISTADATNTLTWDNPLDVGGSVVALVYAYDGSSGPLIRYVEIDDATSTSITIQNSDLAYYATLDSVVCTIWQKNSAPLPDQAGSSLFEVMAGVAGKWPAGQ